MTSAKFRFLIILSVLCPLASAFAGMYAEELDISLRLKSAFEAEPIPLAMLPLWQSAALGIATTVLLMPMLWMTGPIMQTPLESALDMTSSMLYGAVLALAYWSPISARFEAGN